MQTRQMAVAGERIAGPELTLDDPAAELARDLVSQRLGVVGDQVEQEGT